MQVFRLMQPRWLTALTEPADDRRPAAPRPTRRNQPTNPPADLARDGRYQRDVY